MGNSQRKRRVIRTVIAATAASLALMIMAVPFHVSADSLSDLQNQYAALQQQQKQLQSRIASQSSAVQNGQTQMSALNAQVSITQQQLALLKAQIDQAYAEIRDKENSIKDKQSQIAQNTDLLKARLRAMYVNGNDSFLDTLFSSNSVSDFLNRVEILRAVSDHDQKMITNLKEEEQQLQSEQAELEKAQKALLATQGTMAAKQDVLNAQVAQQSQIVTQAQANVQAAQQQAASVAAQASQTNAQISAEFAARAAAARAKATGTSAGSAQSGGSVSSYQAIVVQMAAQYGMSDYVSLILAVMQQESGGAGSDPMQALGQESGATPAYSIQCGIQELKMDLQAAGCTGPTDMSNIELALQGYNFGSGFITWARSRGGYSIANALAYSQLQASQLGWSSYGDTYYVPHVLRYYSAK